MKTFSCFLKVNHWCNKSFGMGHLSDMSSVNYQFCAQFNEDFESLELRRFLKEQCQKVSFRWTSINIFQEMNFYYEIDYVLKYANYSFRIMFAVQQWTILTSSALGGSCESDRRGMFSWNDISIARISLLLTSYRYQQFYKLFQRQSHWEKILSTW